MSCTIITFFYVIHSFEVRKEKALSIMPLFLLFILFPFLEVFFFGVVSGRIGLWNAVGLLFLDSFLGVALIQRQGFYNLKNMKTLERAPEKAFDQFFLILAGLLLFIPGFLSDIMALMLILPFTRSFFTRNAVFRHAVFRTDDTILEGEYETIEDPAPVDFQSTDRDKAP